MIYKRQSFYKIGKEEHTRISVDGLGYLSPPLKPWSASTTLMTASFPNRIRLPSLDVAEVPVPIYLQFKEKSNSHIQKNDSKNSSEKKTIQTHLLQFVKISTYIRYRTHHLSKQGTKKRAEILLAIGK